MENTLEEKKFIAEYHPEIEIEDIEFENGYFTYGDESPIEEICFINDEIEDDYFSEKPADGLYVTFHFRDKGAKFEQKYVSFYDFAQIFDPESETEDFDYSCDTTPELVFDAFADDEGRFSVTVPMVLRLSTEENENEIFADVLKEHGALFMFGEIVIGNQFVNERMKSVNGVIPQKGEKAKAAKLGIHYELADNGKCYDTEKQNPDEDSRYGRRRPLQLQARHSAQG